MKKYLLPETGSFYKANLHCHTTISDGKWTPEEVKKNYMENGYSVVAYTDHNVLVPHYELAEENFLPLNGIEININSDDYKGKYGKTCHFCAIAIEPDNIKQPCFHREKYFVGKGAEYKSKIVFDETKPDYERVYNPDCVNEFMKEFRDNGFFVTYNHPTWSMESYNDYINYHHMHAMEICNFECVSIGHDEHNSKEYDEMLKSGKRIYCVATDDNHNNPGTESSFGGFTMIKADKLEYKAITKALVDGNFYASEGPMINELWIEDKKIHIKCEPAVEIYMKTAYRFTKVKKGFGYPVTEAAFDLRGDEGYIRLVIVDKEGKRAYTNAYFTDKLFGEAE